MDKLSQKIEFVLNQIISKAGNQNELLFGRCTCESNVTNTQKHILMLLEDQNITNKDISIKLNITQAAVTKAIKSLIKDGFIESVKDKNDARVLRYKLSENAKDIANTHKQHHDRSLNTLKNIVSEYTDDEKLIISDFLDRILEEVRD